jgi:hypothetical protein
MKCCFTYHYLTSDFYFKSNIIDLIKPCLCKIVVTDGRNPKAKVKLPRYAMEAPMGRGGA